MDAVFDHVGGRSVVDSWHLLAPGGTLVSYGSASTRDDSGSKQWPVLKILARVWLWNPAAQRPQRLLLQRLGRPKLAQDRFRARLRADLTEVFAALQRGESSPPDRRPAAAGRRPAEALRLAESGTVAGKIVLTP